MPNQYSFEVTAGDAGGRLDAYLASRDELGLSRSRVQQLIESGDITVDGHATRASLKVAAGVQIAVSIPEPQPLDLTPEAMDLDVVYEDSDLLVINKPRDLVVHPAAGHATGTLVHGLLEHVDDLGGIGGVERPGIVHRLDKDTTGLLVVAKSERAHISLSEQIRLRDARREYLALVMGAPDAQTGRIEAAIGRHPVDRKRMAVDVKNGKDAVTSFQVLERFKGYTLLRCRLETGRTHQIRVHMAFIGHPVIGDPVYGPRKAHLGATAQLLHATYLGFTHPASGEWLEFNAPPPDDFQAILDRLRAAAGEPPG